ncbi:MFS transporter [Burkholderia lata]|uniref:MFS transporter n=1 Tax=Burkholderia lata (strain ATCC 17760 / DSM 23089 / LMG 22485 / NCIMB 9086 / R18194 / 383) TaxID=482957 RepID=UPI00145333D5|nr:MFS transporter [Burkholderia lata]VWB87679.1 MFS transporter [Burkholderia lata]
MNAIPSRYLDSETTDPDAVMRKIILRIVPLLFACYVLNFLDRINVGFAQLQMKQDLGFSDAVYGLGAGLFFIGYFFFEVPSNLLLEKIGARKTMLRIMVLWGLASAGTMFVQTPHQFYIIRFLLGLFEAGFFPGMILYLTFWTPASYRARVIALFMTALLVAGVIAGPVSGLILQSMNGVGGLRGWQWMFLLGGLPSCALGVMVYVFLDDRPRDAKWLTEIEKRFLSTTLANEAAAGGGATAGTTNLRQTFTEPLVYLFAFTYFAILAGAFVIAFWMPIFIRERGVSNLFEVGLYSAIPYTVAVVVMLLVSRHSDARNERRWHIAAPAIVGAIALILLPQATQSLAQTMVLLTVMTAGLCSCLPNFWSFVTVSLPQSVSSGGIAIIASMGNLAGFVSPLIIGRIRAESGSTTSGIYLMGAIVLTGMVLMLLATRRHTSTMPARVSP